MRVISFDVFDTLLVRLQAQPGDLFRQLGAELRTADTAMPPPADFARVRQRTELAARRTTPGGEVTLDEIYAALAATLGWNESTRDQARQTELNLEERSLKAVPPMLARVQAARTEADAVWFISDMYLPAAFIERVLRREGFFRDGDQLYVSNEWRATKARGDLFAKARAQATQPITSWKHIGDNPHADELIPRAQGISAELWRDATLNRYEQLARGPHEHEPWRPLLAGVMRRARLANPETEPARRIIWDTGCDVVGPMLLGFVHWCLAQATQRGLRRLYFVARDGQLLHRIAERLAPAWGFDIECRYLHGSRQAWHPAALHSLWESDREWILRRTCGLNVRQTLERLGLAPEQLADALGSAGFSPAAWDAPLTHDATEDLWNFLRSPDALAVITTEAARRRALALRYLGQEGLCAGVPWAMVDIGWHGHLQRSLGRLLAPDDTEQPLTGFYFGLLPGAPAAAGQTLLGYWNQLPARGHGVARLNHVLLELFLSADHGSVLGYREDAGRAVPCWREERNNRALAWGLATLQTAVLKFTECWLDVGERQAVEPRDWLAVTREVYLEFYRRPTCAEAATWGNIPFADGQMEQEFYCLTPPLNGPPWRGIFRGHRPLYWWAEGALAQRACWPLRLYLALRDAKRSIAD